MDRSTHLSVSRKPKFTFVFQFDTDDEMTEDELEQYLTTLIGADDILNSAGERNRENSLYKKGIYFRAIKLNVLPSLITPLPDTTEGYSRK